MNKVFRRVRTVFKRKPRTPKQPPTPAVNTNNSIPITLKNSSTPIEPYKKNFGPEDDLESLKYVNASQSNSIQQRIKDDSSSDEAGSLAPSARSSITVDRKPTSDSAYAYSNDNNANAFFNKNSFPLTNSKLVLPRQSTRNPPAHASINNNVPRTKSKKSSSSTTSSSHANQKSSSHHHKHKDHRNHESSSANRSSALVGFPSSRNRRIRNPSDDLERFPYSERQYRPPYTTQSLSFPLKNRFYNYEIDYPIENVLIDGNIPSSIAIKVNDAVEYDRFGRAYRSQHYAYEPTVQQLNIGNNQQIQRRLVGNSNQSGMRYIREVPNETSYPPQKLFNQTYEIQNLNDLEHLLNNTSQLNFPVASSLYGLDTYSLPPVHYTAWALPNDPMRIY